MSFGAYGFSCKIINHRSTQEDRHNCTDNVVNIVNNRMGKALIVNLLSQYNLMTENIQIK